MALAVDPATAKAKLAEITSHRDNAKKILERFRDTDIQMTSGAWQGNASGVHLKKSDANDAEFNQIIALLDSTIAAAEQGINNVASNDG